MIKSGIYLDLSSKDYHNDKESISRSSLLDFKRNPRKYWANHINPDRPTKEATAAMNFGSAFHTLILEPHLFENQYYVLPEKVLLKNVGREAYDAYKKAEKEAESCEGKVVLSWNDYERLCAMHTSLNGNSRAKALLEGAVYESSYFWEDIHSGLMIKSRPDILNGNIYVDLKSIEDASPSNYQREMAKYGYHIQAAMMSDGFEQLTGEKIRACINICVEKTYPYSVAIYIIDPTAIEHGQYEYKNILLQLKHAIVHNEFADYPTMTIGLPKWAM